VQSSPGGAIDERVDNGNLVSSSLALLCLVQLVELVSPLELSDNEPSGPYPFAPTSFSQSQTLEVAWCPQSPQDP
jgi:hypothetical protein